MTSNCPLATTALGDTTWWNARQIRYTSRFRTLLVWLVYILGGQRGEIACGGVPELRLARPRLTEAGNFVVAAARQKKKKKADTS